MIKKFITGIWGECFSPFLETHKKSTHITHAVSSKNTFVYLVLK